MAGPWEKYQNNETVIEKRAPWQRYQPQEPVYRGSVLPFSRMPSGDVQFDPEAGFIGAIRRAVSLPGEVLGGDVPMQRVDPQTGDVTVPPETIGRALETAAVMSPVNPAVRSGAGLVPGVARSVRRRQPRVPSAEDLLRAGGASFNEMRATGAVYPAGQVKRLAETLMVRLNQDGFDENTASKTFNILKKLANPPDDPSAVATIGNLHSARKTLGKAAQTFTDPADQAAARSAQSALDDFISGQSDILAQVGPPTAAQQRAGQLLAEANANYAAGRRSDLTQGIERAADLRAAAANSGQNTGNTIRQRLASALLKEKDTAGFTPSEKDMLEAIVRGSRSANVTRDIANRLGGGGGLGSAWIGGMGGAAGYGVGSALGMPGTGAAVGASAPMLAGGLLKGMSNRITQRALQEADRQIRMRSPVFRQRLQQAPVDVVRNPRTEALIRMLLLEELQPEGAR